MNNRLQRVIEAAETLNREIAKITPLFTDKTIPLEERWRLFSELSEKNILNNEVDGDGYIEECFALCITDDFCIEKGERKSFVDLLEEIEEMNLKGINEWKEKVLSGGCAFFVYDW